MLPVSEAYKQAIQLHRTNGVRNRMYAQIYFGEFDSTARADAALSASAGVPYSSLANINTDKGQACSYATMERDSFGLEGAQKFLPLKSALTFRQGWISSAMSGADGSFAANPVVTVVFSKIHSMVGLTLLFDDVAGIYASEFTVDTYLDDVLVETHNITNTAVRYEGELTLDNHNKIVVTFTKTCRPYQRIHLQQILFGIGYTFGNEELTAVSLSAETSPITLELPKTELSFSIYNEDGKFNVDADAPIVNFLKDDQQAVFAVGYDVTGNGGVEWLTLCKLWLKSWDVDGIRATFKCNDAFDRLNDKKFETSAYGEQSVKARVEEVFADAGYANYDIDDSVGEIQAKNPFPAETHAKCLQLASNIAMATLEADKNNKIIIRNRLDPTIEMLTLAGDIEAFSSVDFLTSDDAVKEYASLEKGFFALDGVQRFMPDSGHVNTGVVWSDLPEDGAYTPAPTITAEFASNATFGSVDLRFTPYSAPSKLRIQGFRYADSAYTEVYNRVYADLSDRLIAYDAYDRIKKIVITVLENTKDHRARLQRIGCSWDTGFEITEKDIIGNPKGELLTACKDIVVELENLVAGESGQITKTTIAAGDWVRLKNSSPCTDVTVTTEAPGAAVEYVAYAYFTDVRVTGITGDVEVVATGKKLETVKDETAIQSLNLNGEDCKIENPLIDTDSLPSQYLQWVADYLTKRVEWTVNTLGYPQVQAGDKIKLKGEVAYVKKHVLSFNNGACRSAFTLRKEAQSNVAGT